jgi:hypothetical protein
VRNTKNQALYSISLPLSKNYFWKVTYSTVSTVCVSGLWAGVDSARKILLGSGKNSKPEKGSKTAQTPTSPLHALLGNLPADQNLCPKRQHRQLD